MKKLIVLAMLSLAAINVAAQDIIVMRNGDEVEAKVTKVGTTEVEYHKWSNQDGPVYTVAKSDVFMVKYKNGEKDVFDNVTAKSDNSPKSESNSSVPQYVEAVPAANNQELISLYNREVKINSDAPNEKDASYCTPILGVASTSIMSTDEVEVRIVPQIFYHKTGWDYHLKYAIELANKTNKLLYIDLVNSFRIGIGGKSESYYSQETTTVSNTSSSGGGLNLGAVTSALGIGGAIGTLAGGATVGGGSQGGVSTTYTNNRILTIAPHSKQFLSEYKEVNVKGQRWECLSDIEHYEFSFGKRGIVKKNNVVSFSEKDSPYTAGHLITYSTDMNFSKYSTLKVNLYVRNIVGCQWYNYGMSDWGGNREKVLYKRIKGVIPDFTLESNILLCPSFYLEK